MSGCRTTLLAAATMVTVTAVAWAQSAEAKPIKFDLDVTPRVGAAGDRFVVTVTVQLEGVGGPEQFWRPGIRDFRLVDEQVATTRTMEYDSQRGQVLTTVEIRTYTLDPKRTGQLAILPARIRVQGQEFRSRGVTVTVRGTPGGVGTGTDPDPTAPGGVGAPGFREPEVDGAPDQFLHVVVDKRDPYEGEQVIATWLLYAREEPLKFEPMPLRLDDFWAEEIYTPLRRLPSQEAEVNGHRYRVSIVSKRALFPTRSGRVVINPFRGRVQANYARLGAMALVESKPLTLDVKPLPPGAPPGFDPTYVGNFVVHASVDRTEIDAGGSITLTLEVSGTGALRRTTPPELKTGGFSFRAPRDFDESVDTSGLLVAGKRTYRYWATPQQSGAQTVPPLKIAYFDPSSGHYDLAQTEPIALVVRGEVGAAGSSAENFIAPDIRLIRDGTTISSVSMARAYRSIWYWLLLALPVVAFAGVVVGGRVRRGMARDTDRSRVRRARGAARKRFKLADIHLRGNRPAKFFGELAGAIYSHLEGRVGHSLRSLTREELSAELRVAGFDDDIVSRVDEELSNCDFARFTPAASGPGDMKAAQNRTRDLLRDIERAAIDSPAEPS